MSDERTETLERDTAPTRRAPVLGVLVIASPGERGVAHAVRRSVIVGRDATCAVALGDPKVSRQHAELSPEAGGARLRVRDLGSHNGTFVHGARVLEEVVVEPGAILRVGHSLLLVVDDVAAHRGGPLPARSAIVGGARTAELVRSVQALAAASLAPVLVEGETGTGKELFAALVHAHSPRRRTELVTLNCAALPPELVEAELFGHVRGAFSGADRPRAGLVRQADGGTLMLDELGEMPLEVQPKLLRVLETGEVRAVGDDRQVVVDVRFVAATHRDLEAQIARGTFRADLFHRIAALRVRLPPLRDRPEDVPALAEKFLEGEGVELGVDALERLACARWPGNARELRNTLAAAVARARARGGTSIEPSDLPDTELDARHAVSDARAAPADDDTLRARIAEALRVSGGNVAEAARLLGTRRQGLYEQMKRLGLDPARYR